MSIVKFNPFDDANSLQHDFNRMFESMFQGRRQNETEVAGASWRPMMDVHEDENEYIVDVELPGVSKDDVSVSFQDGTLTVSGERKYQNESNEKNRHRIERFFGKFHRSVSFTTAVDGSNIGATFDNGVLKITLPKAEEIKPRRIEIA